MTPYRTTPQRAPDVPDVDVMRFAARSRRARRSRKTAALATMALVVAASVLPLAFPAHGAGALALQRMDAVAPLDPPPRRMPPVHAVVVGPWTCMPHDPTQPMSEWELEAEFGRELYNIDCANTFW
jgi:hypothetical protein